MRSIEQLSEKQGLTVHQLRTTLARLEKQGYGSLTVHQMELDFRE